MQEFCYLTVSTTPFCCNILLGEVSRIIVTFTDKKTNETDFPVIILNEFSLNGQEFVIF